MRVSALVRLLEADPDLGAGLEGEQRSLAQRVLLASVAEVAAGGPLSDVLATVDADRLLGLVVLDGLAVRRVEVVGRAGIELIGPGDVVQPWGSASELASVPARVSWRATVTTQLAILDEDAQHVLARFPAVMRNLMTRMAARADSLALNLALAQLPRVDARLLVLFWHLADRFGRVEGDRVVIPLALSHTRLAELVFAQRPSVTKALQELAARGILLREGTDRWQLSGSPPGSGADLLARIGAGADFGDERVGVRVRGTITSP